MPRLFRQAITDDDPQQRWFSYSARWMSNNKREVAAMDTAVKQDRIRDFRAQVIRDAAAALCGVTVSIGDRLGLYTAIAGRVR